MVSKKSIKAGKLDRRAAGARQERPYEKKNSSGARQEKPYAKPKSTGLKQRKTYINQKSVEEKQSLAANKLDMKKKKNSSRCPVSGSCGGCQYIDMEYAAQLEKKSAEMEKLLGEFGPVDKVIGMENPLYYRNKVTAEFKRLRNGDIISGIYEAGTHNVIEVNECFVEDKRAGAIVKTFARLIKSFKLQLFNEDTGTGLIRHLQIRTGYTTGQIMVTIVTASAVFPSKKNLANALLKEHPEITTIVQNINSKATSMVLGDRNQVIYGKGFIEDVLSGKKFRISPNSFYQVNPVQTEILYNKAIKYADLKKKETVIDAYCGIGTIGIAASGRAKRVIGVELNPAAVRDAEKNASINRIDNVEFYNNDAGRFMVELAEQGEKIDVVFMDPPRSGSTEEFMSSVIKLGPKKVVYVSCGPDTLARDLKYMTRNGYKVIKISPVDMFPFTEHVETCVLLTKSSEA